VLTGILLCLSSALRIDALLFFLEIKLSLCDSFVVRGVMLLNTFIRHRKQTRNDT